MIKRELLSLLFIVLIANTAIAQCFTVTDGNGVQSNNPYFISCTPGGFTIFVQPNVAIGPYTIDWGDGQNSAGASLVPPALEQHTYAATTDTFLIVITNTADGCVVNGVVVMERNPLASIQLPTGDDNFGCTPVQFRFLNSSTQISQTTTFTWDFGDGTPPQVFDYTNLNDTVYHTYLPGIGTQSCELEVRLTATNYCGSSTASFFPLRVWDLDEANITASSTLLCYPDTIVQYTNATIRNCFPEGNQTQRYEYWNFGNYWGLGYDSIINWRPWNPPIVPPPAIGYPGVGTYQVMLIDSSYCGKDTSFLSITITNPPTAILVSNRDSICEGESVTFTNNSIGGANVFFWDFGQGAGFQNQNAAPKTRTYNTSGDYTIFLAVGVTGSASCVDTASVNLYVNPSPTAGFNFSPNNQCDTATVSFTNTSTGNIVQWTWDFDNGNFFSGANPPSQFYASAGAYNVKLVVENDKGCRDSIIRVVNVRQIPQAKFGVSSVCLNQVATFNDSSIANIDPVTSYKWYFGDGDSSTAQNPNHLYTAFGTYQVVQIVSNGFCTDSDTLVVVVENTPTAAFTVDVNAGCSALPVNFTNASSANAVSFVWDFGDGSPLVTARDTNHVFQNATSADTSFIVSLIARTAFGCADTSYDTISVYPVPVPSFTSDAILDCGPVLVNFTNTTLGANLNFFWNFGDGTPVINAINPTHIFQNTTLFISNYQVQLIVVSSNGCRDTTTQTVTIYPEPIFTFAVVPDSGCSPLPVTFPAVVGAVSYKWNFGDGDSAVGPSPTHIYTNTTTNNRTYQVRLIAQNSFGCLDTSYNDVVVFPSPTSSFVLDTNLGCQPLPIQFTNTSTGANSYQWDFGDGTGSTSGSAVFSKTYTNTTALTVFNTIQLITTTSNLCKDTSSQVVQIHPFVDANFSSNVAGCHPFPVSFTNLSIGGANFRWSFGDGDTSLASSPSHVYQNSSNSNQNFTAKLRVTSPQACVDSFSRTILVYPKPIATFAASDTLGCHPLQVTLSNSSVNADSCLWTYGDGANFTLCTPSNQHTYNNTTSFFPIDYATRLVVFTDEGCRDTLSQTIRVNPQIIADFNSDTAGCSPFPVSFQNQSTGAQQFQWDFRDGASSQAGNPSHVFTNPILNDSIFRVKLLVSSQYGCSDSIEKPIKIYPKPIANYVLDQSVGCHPLPVLFTNSSSIADSCSWRFGDASFDSSCFITQTHVYQNATSNQPQNFISSLVVFTNNGCRDTLNQSIRVNPNIIADFTSDTAGCHPLPINFNDNSTGVQNYNWTFGDGGTSVASNPSHYFLNLGIIDTTFTTKLVVSSAFGCSDSIEQRITVFPKPIADFATSSITGCQPLPIAFTNNSTLSDSCRWTFGDGTGSVNCGPIVNHTYTNTLSIVPQNYQARLIVLSDRLCRDTLTQSIEVKPLVVSDFSGDSVGCSPLANTFRSQSFGAISYTWDFGDGAVANGLISNHVFTNTGAVDSTYRVRLIARSLYQCDDTSYLNVLVHPTPLTNFTATPGFQIFPNSTVVVNNTTNAGNWSFLWDYDDSTTSTLQNPSAHLYTKWGVYNIKLVASSPFCSDSINQVIEIDVPFPVADFKDSTSGCAPLEVSFENLSIYGDRYLWNFGDGGTSTAENPSHTYLNEGSYKVSLQVFGFESGKEDFIERQDYIKVYKSPRAGFFTNKETVFIPNDPLVFFNQSIDADNYVWDFGDGNSSIEFSPTHYYVDEGSFQISLVAASSNGCSDTFYLPNLVLAKLEGTIKVPNAFTPNRNRSNGGQVNPFAGVDELNDVFYAKVAGTVSYELNIFNKWGELLFVSKDVKIGWDGYYKGELCQQDAYVWKVTAEFADGRRIVRIGDLLLLR